MFAADSEEIYGIVVATSAKTENLSWMRKGDVHAHFVYFFLHATFKRSAKPLASRRTLHFLLCRLLRRRQEQGALQPSL